MSLIYHEGTMVLSVAQFSHTLMKLISTASIHHPVYVFITYEYIIIQFLTWYAQSKSTLCCDFAHLGIQEGLSGMLGCSLFSSASHPPRWLAAQGSYQSGLDIHNS